MSETANRIRKQVKAITTLFVRLYKNDIKLIRTSSFQGVLSLGDPGSLNVNVKSSKKDGNFTKVESIAHFRIVGFAFCIQIPHRY